MINLGVYNEYLTNEIQSYINKRSKNKDPYEQMVIDAEIKILEKNLFEYKNLIINQ